MQTPVLPGMACIVHQFFNLSVCFWALVSPLSRYFYFRKTCHTTILEIDIRNNNNKRLFPVTTPLILN